MDRTHEPFLPTTPDRRSPYLCLSLQRPEPEIYSVNLARSWARERIEHSEIRAKDITRDHNPGRR